MTVVCECVLWGCVVGYVVPECVVCVSVHMTVEFCHRMHLWQDTFSEYDLLPT